mgnify:FL=1
MGGEETTIKGATMLLRNNLFRFEKPDNFQNLSTSRLMNGLVYDFNDPYIPFFTPIGTRLFNNIENIFKQNAMRIDCNEVIIPQLMTTELLTQGQEIGELFGRKVMHLSGTMAEFHLLTSPEMMFINMLKKNKIESNALPIHYYFVSNFFRDMHDPKNILRTKQLRVIAGVSFDKTQNDRLKTENKLLQTLHNTFVDCKVPFLAEYGSSGFTCEYFYMNSKETENYIIPSINPHKKTKALSFAMIYDYGQECPFDVLHKNSITGLKDKTFMTSYAISAQRLLYVIMDSCRDSKGFSIPSNIRPYDVALITNEQRSDMAQKMARDLSCSGISSYIDNMFTKAHVKRLDVADYIGVGLKIVNKNDKFTVFNRDGEMLITGFAPDLIISAVKDSIIAQKQK